MTKEKLDLGAAFAKLKKSDHRTLLTKLVEAERYVKQNNNDPYKYPFAFGLLTGAVKAYLFVNSNLAWDDIDTLIKSPALTEEKQGNV